MEAMRAAAASEGNWRLGGRKVRAARAAHVDGRREEGVTTLYSTLEPCPMCLSAALAFRIDRVVYGAKDTRLGALGSYVDLTQLTHPYHNGLEVVGGVMAEEGGEIIRQFFRERRKASKREKMMKAEKLSTGISHDSIVSRDSENTVSMDLPISKDANTSSRISIFHRLIKRILPFLERRQKN